MLKNESKILNEFFMKDLTKLIEKYNNIDKEIIEKLDYLVYKVVDRDIKEALMKDFNTTITLISELSDDVDNDVLQLYFFIKNNIKEINIVEVISIYEEIQYKGYSKIDDIIMYSKLEDLREYVRDEIEGILSCSYEVDRLFDKDTIIDYFLEGTSIGEIAREMVNNCDEYEEVLNIDPEIMFEAENGQEYYYAYINN